jgi:integral membrane protein (TIGR01906 family)
VSCRLLHSVAAVLFVVALPLALVLTNVRLLVFDPGYYQRGYERNEVPRTTSMTAAQLAEATAQVQAYLGGGPPVSLTVQKEWGSEPLFNAREQAHLADVRDLLTLALRVQESTALYVLGTAAALLLLYRSRGAVLLARWLTIAASATLALFAILGLFALGDFDWFWTQFHRLSFSNDLWLLDPRTDYMIRLYPVPFWFAAVLDVVLRSVGVALALLVAAQYYLRWLSPERRPRPINIVGSAP